MERPSLGSVERQFMKLVEFPVTIGTQDIADIPLVNIQEMVETITKYVKRDSNYKLYYPNFGKLPEYLKSIEALPLVKITGKVSDIEVTLAGTSMSVGITLTSSYDFQVYFGDYKRGDDLYGTYGSKTYSKLSSDKMVPTVTYLTNNSEVYDLIKVGTKLTVVGKPLWSGVDLKILAIGQGEFFERLKELALTQSAVHNTPTSVANESDAGEGTGKGVGATPVDTVETPAIKDGIIRVFKYPLI